jgi:hypothetical protein
MFENSSQRLDVIKMCEDCRVVAITEDGARSPQRLAAAQGAHHRGLSARTRGDRKQNGAIVERLHRTLDIACEIADPGRRAGHIAARLALRPAHLIDGAHWWR